MDNQAHELAVLIRAVIDANQTRMEGVRELRTRGLGAGEILKVLAPGTRHREIVHLAADVAEVFGAVEIGLRACALGEQLGVADSRFIAGLVLVGCACRVGNRGQAERLFGSNGLKHVAGLKQLFRPTKNVQAHHLVAAFTCFAETPQHNAGLALGALVRAVRGDPGERASMKVLARAAREFQAS